MGWFQIMLIIVSISSTIFWAGFLLHNNQDILCRHLIYGGPNPKVVSKHEEANIHIDLLVALTSRVEEVLNKLETLRDKLELITVQQQMEKKKQNKTSREELIVISRLDEYKKFLEDEVIRPLHISLKEINNVTLINNFVVEEIRKYITPKENRVGGEINIYGSDKVYNTIGNTCVVLKKELEEYMDYDVGSYCKDDWILGQELMIRGCDPLPRRRCLSRASKLYLRPYPINESLWRMPEDRNVRWSNYKCRNFECLSSKTPPKKSGYSNKYCNGCFEMEKEKLKWVANNNNNSSGSGPMDFVIKHVLAIKAGEIRIGLDYGVGTGTFAARMREENVTIVSTALNLGAPFNEMIALRGLIPLYVTLNQRLPFFDNTMDMIHTSGLMDGWIDLELMDFILFDLDRVLRPGGFLWIDRFFCKRTDLDEYIYMFLQLRYRKHRWVIAPKSKDQVFLSALLEKPPRSL